MEKHACKQLKLSEDFIEGSSAFGRGLEMIASRLFQRGAKAGYVDCLFALGMVYANGFGYKIEKNEEKANEIIKEAAQKGVVALLEANLDEDYARPHCAYFLGYYHKTGRAGNQIDYELSRRYHEMATENGYGEALREIGIWHRDGVCNEKKNPKIAFDCFQRAYDETPLRNYGALSNLAFFYYGDTPDIVKRDIDRFLLINYEAAHEGHQKYSYYNIGLSFISSWGKVKDNNLAACYLLAGAESGHEFSMRELRRLPESSILYAVAQRRKEISSRIYYKCALDCFVLRTASVLGDLYILMTVVDQLCLLRHDPCITEYDLSQTSKDRKDTFYPYESLTADERHRLCLAAFVSADERRRRRRRRRRPEATRMQWLRDDEKYRVNLHLYPFGRKNN